MALPHGSSPSRKTKILKRDANLAKTAVLSAPGKLELADRRVPAPIKGQVTINVKAAGIGGTDLRIYKGILPASYPLVLGQEFSGEVHEVGEGVDGIRKGERVSIEPVIRCGRCSYCTAGRYTLCDQLKVVGVHADGGFSEQVTVPDYSVNRLPENISFEEGALVTPAAVALYALSRSEAKPGASFAIVGGGPIGLSVVQFAKLTGALQVILCEPLEKRRRLGERFGATQLVSPSDDMAKKVAELTGGVGVDVVVEASGVPENLEECLKMVKRGGRVVLAGAFGKPGGITVMNIVRKDLEVTGAWLYPNHYSRALSLLSKSKINLKDYVTRQMPLGQVAEAFQAADDPETFKVILKP